jgi:hypothetical protein
MDFGPGRFRLEAVELWNYQRHNLTTGANRPVPLLLSSRAISAPSSPATPSKLHEDVVVEFPELA